jgi:PAS domain-containing protein
MPAALNPSLLPLAYTAPLLALICTGLNRIGQTRPAAWLFLVGFIALTTARSLYVGGVGAPPISLFSVMTLFAGVTLGGRPGLATAFICAGLAFALARLEQEGVTTPFTGPPMAAWVSVCIVIGCTLFLAQISIGRTTKALREARAELAARTSAERKLALALESGGIGTYVADLHGDHMVLDQRALTIFGLTRAADPGCGCAERF